MSDLRQVVESPVRQGKDEVISYQLTTTPWGSSPTSISVVIIDVTGGGYTALTAGEMTTVMPVNSPSATGDVITLSPLQALTPGTRYRVEVKFTSGGDVWEPWFIVEGEN